ncbi:MAG: sigma-70 family RNA polymerase sigma factor [Myxococcota bacterium]
MDASADLRSDEQLVDAWHAGERSATGELIARYNEPLRRYYRRRLGPGHYEDELQRSWVAILQSLPRFRGQSSVRTFVYAIANNCVREAWRRRNRSRRVFAPMKSHLDPQPSPHAVLSADRSRQALQRAMDELPDSMQRMLRLYYWEHRTAGEIGTIFSIPEDTARSRIRRAKGLLRDRLQPQFDA